LSVFRLLPGAEFVLLLPLRALLLLLLLPLLLLQSATCTCSYVARATTASRGLESTPAHVGAELSTPAV
jgi:hypothetical protein